MLWVPSSKPTLLHASLLCTLPPKAGGPRRRAASIRLYKDSIDLHLSLLPPLPLPQSLSFTKPTIDAPPGLAQRSFQHEALSIDTRNVRSGLYFLICRPRESWTLRGHLGECGLGLSLPGNQVPSGLSQGSHGDAADKGTEKSPFFSTIYGTSFLLGESQSNLTIGKKTMVVLTEPGGPRSQ